MNLLRVIRNTFQSPTAIAPNPTCPACGQGFACGMSLRGCWCSEIQLADVVRAELKRRYTGCLCRACLERVAEKANRPAAAECG
jgi:ribosomal protein L34E